MENEFNQEIYKVISKYLQTRGICKSYFSTNLGLSTNTYAKMERECRFLTIPKFYHITNKLQICSSSVMFEAGHYFWFTSKLSEAEFAFLKLSGMFHHLNSK